MALRQLSLYQCDVPEQGPPEVSNVPSWQKKGPAEAKPGALGQDGGCTVSEEGDHFFLNFEKTFTLIPINSRRGSTELESPGRLPLKSWVGLLVNPLGPLCPRLGSVCSVGALFTGRLWYTFKIIFGF